ncbi:23S rRNA (adenine2503-C2)-methyltransferase [Apostasia shenzhenica]|uniref:23S rRNA (Adenine2503-C2)-methyltransferase n=1 Tax=Apostasia shenzhenica TaxID=1088818 RepID=A0A2I0AWH5_9ASPA|nr:23S rRNA (adenine2503-C2)-methyltransferase [Apostasia shenzhenica]
MAFRSVFDAEALRNEFEMAGISSQLIPRIWKHVRQKPNVDLDEVPSLPAAAYPILRSKFRAMTSSLSSNADSKDKLTTKLLIRLQEGTGSGCHATGCGSSNGDAAHMGRKEGPTEKMWHCWHHQRMHGLCCFLIGVGGNGAMVEAVIMRYDTRLGKYDGKPRPGGLRATLCVSSQVGCKMACKFCATGTMGFKNNLSSGEIVEQLVHASRFSDIRNVVFMGMGEPLNNFNAVVEAIKVMTASPFQLSPKRVTVSTVGIINAIKKFNGNLPSVNLAVSLHAPDQETRCQIMPSARAFPLGRLIEALLEYQKKSQQKILIEYIMLDAVNDLLEHAHQLGKLLQTLEVNYFLKSLLIHLRPKFEHREITEFCLGTSGLELSAMPSIVGSLPVVNLIPYNPIKSSSNFRTSKKENVEGFQKVLRGVYNIRTTIRQQMGTDISGACGQLVVNLSEQRSTEGACLLSDIEDLRI